MQLGPSVLASRQSDRHAPYVNSREYQVGASSCSLNLVQLGQRILEVAHANAIVRRLGQLLGTIVDRVELANLVAEADLLEQRPNCLATAKLTEFVLADAILGEVRREQQIDCLRLVSVVLIIKNRRVNIAMIISTYLVISNTLEFFVWDVFADGWHAEGA